MPVTKFQKDLIEAVLESVYSKIDIESGKQVTAEGLRSFIRTFKATLKCRSIRDAEADYKTFFQYYLQPLPMYNISELGDRNITAQEVKTYMFEFIDDKVQAAAKHLSINLDDLNWDIDDIKRIKPDNISLCAALKIIKNSIYDKAGVVTKSIIEGVQLMPLLHKIPVGILGAACIVSTASGEVASLYAIAIGGIFCIGAPGIIEGIHKVAEEYTQQNQSDISLNNSVSLAR